MAGSGAEGRQGDWRRFDSSRVNVRERTPAWERLTRDLLLPLRLDAPAGPILGTIAGRRAGPVRQLSLVASAHFGVRTRRLAAGVGSDQCSIAFATNGRVQVRQYGRKAVLLPGQCAIYDTSDPFAVGSPAPFGTEIVMFPIELLGLPPGRVAQLAGRPIGGSLAARIRLALQEWAQQPGADMEEVCELFADIGADMTIVNERPRTDEEIAAAATHLVDRHLADPRLGPDFVAAVLGVSRRRLYYSCADRLGPFASYVRIRRLESAARLLTEPASAGLSITEIARRSGFPDLAHFSRLFTGHFGAPPTQWRQSRAQRLEVEPEPSGEFLASRPERFA